MQQREADKIAIVVLGAAVWPGGKPSPTLKRRAEHGADLLSKEEAQIAILSGGLGRNPPSEAQVMHDIFCEKGISNKRLLFEDQSTNTFENVAMSAALLRKHGFNAVIVVTDPYHLPRARMCFRYLGFRVDGSAPPRGKHKTALRRTLWSWIRELIALPYYRLTLSRRLRATK